MASAADGAVQQQSEQQPQLLSGADILATGTMGGVEEPDERPGGAHDQVSQSVGSQGAAREGLHQPKALHDEQFPGNGAQVCPIAAPEGMVTLLHKDARCAGVREKRWFSTAASERACADV